MAENTINRRRGDPILRKIDGIRRSVALWLLGWGYLWVVLIVAVFVFGGVLVDHAFVLQKWGRVAFFRAFLLSLSTGAVAATLFPLLRRVSRIYIARRMEQQRPELRNALISYLQCREDPSVPAELKALMARKAAGYMRSLDCGVVVDHSGYLRLAVAVALVLAAFLFYWGFAPKSTTASLERLFRPRADIHPPTATQLFDVRPGEVYLVRGSRPPIAAVVRGVRPDSVYAVWNGASFSGRRILLTPKDGNLWQGAFPPVLEDGSYYLAAGDTRTDLFGIHVLPRPVVEQVRLDIMPPAHTGLPRRTAINSDIEVPSGTRVRVRVETSVPPARGYLDFEGGRRTWLDPVPGRQALAGELTVLESASYQVRFESMTYPDGSTFSNSSPVTYRIVCLSDKPPTVSLTAPEDGIRLEATDSAAIAYRAADDYGIASVRLHYSVNGLSTQQLAVAEPGVKELKAARYDWDLAGTSARPGQTLTYYLEVEDNRPGRGQVARSELRHIVIAGESPQPERMPAAPPARPQQQEAEGRQPDREGDMGERVQEPVERQAGADVAEGRQGGGAERDAGPGEDSGKNPFQEYADYVRSIYEAMGQEPPGEGEGGQRQAPQMAGPGQEGQPQPGSAQQPSGQEAQRQPGGRQSEERTEQGAPGQASAGQQGPGGEDQQGTGASGQGAEEAAGGQGSPQAGGQGSAQGTGRSAGAAGGQGEGAESGAQSGTRAADAGQAGTGRQGAGPGSAGQGGAETAVGVESNGAGGAPGTSARSDGSARDSDEAGGGGGAGGTGARSLPEPGQPTPRVIESIEDLDAAVEGLSRMLEADRVPERVFRDLGLNRERLREFIEEYRRRRRDMAEPGADEEPGELSDDAGRLLRGVSAEGDVQVEDTRASPTRDTLHSRFEGAAESLSSRYRDLVNQYYKVLSEEQ